MALRYYANAPATTLAASCTAVDTSIQVASVTGLPVQFPFVLIIGRGTASEEAVEVTNAAGTTLTVTRGVDSTTAFAHNIGDSVAHGITARDIREANEHVNETDGVHGVTGDVVGDSDAQILTNKTIDLTDNTVTGTAAEFNAALSDGDFATQAGAETLTNKDLSSGTNTFPADLATDAEVTAAVAAHEADTSTHGVTGDIVGTSDAQTLTNKTLESPAVTGVGERHFVAKSVAESVTSSTAFQSDDELLFPADANASYIVEVDLRFDGFDSNSTAEGGISVALSVPAGATIEVGDLKGIGTDTQVAEDQNTFGVDVYNALTFRALVRTAGTAGNVTLRWAQKFSSATATRIVDGSWLEARRVA